MKKFLKRLYRTFCSRYTISAILLCLELVLLGYILFGNFPSVFYLIVAAVAVAIPALLNIINKNTDPEYKIPWVIVILILPLVGPLIYCCFYNRRMSRGEARFLRNVFGLLRQPDSERNNSLIRLAEKDPGAAGKAHAIMNDDPLASLYTGTDSTFFQTGEKYFASLISDLECAEKYIFLEYFIIDEGELWNSVHDILVDKARQGLDVRLIYDDIGCMKTLPSYYEKELRREGIRTYRFNRVSPKISPVHQNRDHRKICVIDGQIGYTGGVNIADEYNNTVVRFGYWKDGGIRLHGSAVEGLLKLFLSHWDYTSRTVSDSEYLISAVAPSEQADGGYYIPFGSGPAPIYKRSVGKNAFLNLINQASKYIYITTPYLVVDYDLTTALCNAALRGVDVRIVTPGVADKRMIKLMTKSSYPYLIDAGVKIYEFRPGFIHEKSFVTDDDYAVIGTINFDYRSLMHNFENAVWIYGSSTVTDVRDGFLATLNDSEKMDKRKSRLTPNEWLFKTLVRIFAPLM